MREIKLSNYHFPALVDDSDYDKLNVFKWFLDVAGYPVTHQYVSGKNQPVRMHRIILGLVGREMGDHKNHNKLDNTHDNLRKCTNAENTRNGLRRSTNTSGFKGVSFNKKKNRWDVYITMFYKHIYIGSSKKKEVAALLYDNAAKIYFGEFAHLNFP